jgi:hypothetical protein
VVGLVKDAMDQALSTRSLGDADACHKEPLLQTMLCRRDVERRRLCWLTGLYLGGLITSR